jgi:hypothetical protein
MDAPITYYGLVKGQKYSLVNDYVHYSKSMKDKTYLGEYLGYIQSDYHAGENTYYKFKLVNDGKETILIFDDEYLERSKNNFELVKK